MQGNFLSPTTFAACVWAFLLLLHVPLSTAQVWQKGKATHYGPYPSVPAYGDAGYQANEVGVGCSTGIPGNDPRWNAIVNAGTYPNPLNPSTVYPKQPLVAVSAAAYPNKKKICYKTLKIRSADFPELPTIEAYVVDFCPDGPCNWPKEELATNVDLYGEATWKALGGKDGGGTINLEIQWPEDVPPWQPKEEVTGGVTGGDTSGTTGGSVAVSSDVGLSSGSIAAIVIGSIVFSASVTFGVWLYMRRRAQALNLEPQAGPTASEVVR